MSSVLTEQQLGALGEGTVGLFEEVLSVLGHDLRSPLGAAHLNIEAALSHLPANWASAREIRAPLQRASEIMRQTVAFAEDLLREARALEARALDARTPGPVLGAGGAGSPGDQPQLVDVRALIHDCVALQSTALQAARCQLTVHCDTAIIGPWSRTAIHQILSNLITNATKYAPGTPIEVHASRSSKSVLIVVSDLGPGFTAAEQERVFERFHREPRAGAPEGFGMGLWIVRRAVERLGATIRLISAPGEGALFLVEIPC